jgi:ATP-binding cassette, subfamily B, bacterial MsbA
MTQGTAAVTESSKPRKRGLGSFWRAARFVGPYRRFMVISILAAFLVGGAGTIGLTMLLPIMKVLLSGDTVPGYVERALVEKRLGVVLDENTAGRVLRVTGKAARELGIAPGDVVAYSAEPWTVSRAGEVRRIGAPAEPWYGSWLLGLARLLPPHPVAALAWMLGAVLLLAVVANFFRFFQEHLSNMVAVLATQDVRRKAYDHVLYLRLSYFGQRGTSDLTSRLVSDAAALQEGFKLLLGQSIQAPISAGMAFLLAVWIDWRLTLFIIVFAPVNIWIIKTFGKKIRRATRIALEKNSKMLTQLEASLTGIQVVKAAGAERFERRRYSAVMGELVEQQRKMSRYDALTTPTMETLTMVVVSLIVLFAAYLVLVDKTLGQESFFLIMACLLAMGESLRKMSKLNNLLQRANAAAGRIFEIIDLPTERRRELTGAEDRKPKLAELSREITFENVSFAYPGSSTNAVTDVSLTVPRGRVVAVVGRNGSGKTTLLRLLPRLYEPTGGRILVDGVDVAGVTLGSLRGQISLVTQESIIFPGTVHENIAYGLPLASRAEVEAAARKAFAHDFIVARSGGYDSMLEGLGGQLSGGQRQRLCIARAILRAAPILILDEATSQVDAESEHLIQQAIDSLMRDAHDSHRTTTFVIAHRFSTILGADEIVVIDQGRVVGRGKHRDLLAECGVYRQLYERQLMGE